MLHLQPHNSLGHTLTHTRTILRLSSKFIVSEAVDFIIHNEELYLNQALHVTASELYIIADTPVHFLSKRF